MRTMFGSLKAILGLALLGTVFVSVANAQCGCVQTSKRNALMLQQPSSIVQSFRVPVSFLASEVSQDSRGANRDAIVGFWKVNFLSKGNTGIPDGAVLDAGFSQWHSDGTEILNSSRPPATGSFCLGVWARTGQLEYQVNHFAISWNPDGTLLGPANIREEVTLDRDHDSYTGTFTIRQYDQAGHLVVQLNGEIEATRITMDTTIADVL